MIERAHVRLNLDTTDTREAKHTAEDRKLVGNRLAEITATRMARVTAEGVKRKFYRYC